LGTLADNTVVKTGLTPAAFGEDLFVISVDANWAIHDATPGDAPLEIGFNHGDLSVGEVEEALTAELTDPDDIIAKERARRPVRRAGQFILIAASESLNDGRLLRTKCKFSVGDGHFLEGFVANHSGSAMTTGAICEIGGTIFGRWQR